MKCSSTLHFIWVFTVCKIARGKNSSIYKVINLVNHRVVRLDMFIIQMSILYIPALKPTFYLRNNAERSGSVGRTLDLG